MERIDVTLPPGTIEKLRKLTERGRRSAFVNYAVLGMLAVLADDGGAAEQYEIMARALVGERR